MLIILLLLPCLALAAAGPTVPLDQGELIKVMDSMLENLSNYAKYRDEPAGKDALNKTFELYYTAPNGMTTIKHVRNCYTQEGVSTGLKTYTDTFVYDPTCIPMVKDGPGPWHLEKTNVPLLIRMIDADHFEKNGIYVMDRKENGVSKLYGKWLATQKKTKKTMNCDVILKFQNVGFSQVGLTGMAMDCDSCNFTNSLGQKDMIEYMRQRFPIEL